MTANRDNGTAGAVLQNDPKLILKTCTLRVLIVSVMLSIALYLLEYDTNAYNSGGFT